MGMCLARVEQSVRWGTYTGWLLARLLQRVGFDGFTGLSMVNSAQCTSDTDCATLFHA